MDFKPIDNTIFHIFIFSIVNPNFSYSFKSACCQLSAIINTYKQLSFPNYIKDLKITTAINRLSDTPELLKFSFQGLAEHFGFKTAGSFTAAFYKKTGVSPSEFLKELKLRKIPRHS
jgi:AraC-like DNA-binding protein